MVEFMINFGNKLKRLRLEKELTQQELGDQLGLNRATVSSYETSALYPSVEMLTKNVIFFKSVRIICWGFVIPTNLIWTI